MKTGGLAVMFPYRVITCVTVSVVLGANANEVVCAQYDMHWLPLALLWVTG